MCATCGCEHNENLPEHGPHGYDHAHEFHEQDRHYEQDSLHKHQEDQESHGDENDATLTHNHRKTVAVEKDILYENNLLAQRNRGYFEAKNILAINLVSSPGSGKTTLLEKTVTDLKNQLDFYVIEGDQQTSNDANRIQATGTKAVQINTGKGCHLDAHMILHAVQGIKPKENAVLLIENVGNLICPAMFDLGEKERVVIISVTEGEDKPLKYPDMFYSSTLCIINKIDLLPYVSFDVGKAKEYAKRINPQLKILEVSCTGGQGLQLWYDWLQSKIVLPEIVPET
jgi:hydrogenase nickel incorporation protein HypB